MERKYRYSLKKVSLWVLVINTLLGAMALAVLFYVKQPYQTLDMRTFSIPRFIGRQFAGAVFQIFFYYLALNWYYRLLARKASWKKYLPLVLVLTVCCFVSVSYTHLDVYKRQACLPVPASTSRAHGSGPRTATSSSTPLYDISSPGWPSAAFAGRPNGQAGFLPDT